ncbi:MAG TPA: caspase family protein [Nordella sp.]|nr:caspase family protein [Nordella sp.]
MLLAFGAMLLANAAQADEKPLRGVALVIGNGAYENLPKLANPGNDADAIEALLSDLGFDSVRRTDRGAVALKRDLERFAEDARDADVAILYYSGHGIEAAGENYLVPVDADISALDAAGERLVPVSALIARLQAEVPVFIVMLDACRDNPFPPNALVRASSAATPAPITAGGLGETRSAVSVEPAEGTAPAGRENVGSVIAFAAEPGRVALDGSAGANSPYTAAVLRHLSAMNGEEFGMVMRMVAEEVYLKTDGKQRPWMNESLRRLLHFGGTPKEADGFEGDILRERRKLLVTISALPDAERRRIEKVSAEGGVPMDAVFAILKAMGEEAPSDPAALEEALRRKAEVLREMTAERQALVTTDPEISRLMGLADRAINEGALDTAMALQAQASEVVDKQREKINDVQQDINARLLEFAAVGERQAETFLLGFKHRFAAEAYEGLALDLQQIDPQRSYHLARKAIAAYIDAGRYGRGAVEQAAGYYLADETLGYAQKHLGEVEVADHKSDLAYLLYLNGDAMRKVAQIEEARAIFDEIIPVLDRDGTVAQKVEGRRRLGALQFTLGSLTGDEATLARAVELLEQALSLLGASGDPSQQAGVERTLATALARLGGMREEAGPLERASALLKAQLAGLTAEGAPLEWAATQEALGDVSRTLGIMRGDRIALGEAVGHYRAALAERPKEKMPRQHNETLFALAEALRELGQREDGDAALVESVSLHQAVLADRQSDYESNRWADSVVARGLALQALAVRSGNAADAADAVASFNEAFFLFRRNAAGMEAELFVENEVRERFVENSIRIASALEDLAALEGKASRLALAVEARRNALDVARTLPDRASQLAKLEAALQTARSRLTAAGKVSFAADGPIRARFETEAAAWSTDQLTSGLTRIERAREEQTAARWTDASSSFQAALDSSFAGVAPADRARMRLGHAQSLVGAAMLAPQSGPMDPLLEASDGAFADEGELGANALAPLRVDLAYLIATRFQAASAGRAPTAPEMAELVMAAGYLRLAIASATASDNLAGWTELADFVIDNLVVFSAQAADQDTFASEMTGLARSTLAATAASDKPATARRARQMADAAFRAAVETDTAAIAEAAKHARRAIELYAGLDEYLNAARAHDTLCSIVSFQAKAAADKAMAGEAVAACEKAVSLAAADPNGATWQSYLAGQLDAVRKIRAAIP